MSESAPLAIIGISCLFPKADDLQAYWRNIKNGVDAITSVPEDSHWKSADYFNADPKAPDQTYARRGGFISAVDFNPMDFGIAPKDVEATDTTQLLGLMAARQALIDAGYESKPFPRERTSVILGVTGALELVIPLGARLGHPIWRRALKESGVADPVADDVVRRISDSYVGWQENSFPGLLGNVAAGRIASRLDLGGTNCVVDAACASSMAALHLAALELASGRSDMVVTGGLDTFNDIFMYMCFSKTPALSPSGDAKPFDRSCDGTILGEGLGMLVLKRLADAERDGDRVYAVLKGIGSSSDGRGNAIYAPRAEGQREALNRAYASAGAGPETIELIEAHGTGTKVGDATELQALSEVYRAAGRQGTWTALGSVKSQIGHTKAAAGVAGLIKAAMALHHKILPPTIKVTQPVDEAAPGRSPFYVNTAKRPWLPRTNHPRRAGVSAFGFGGTNFHCVLEEHSARRTKPGWDGDVEILALSALTREEIATQVRALPASPPWPELRERARRSRAAFDPAAPFRLLLPIVRGSALAALRDSALAMLDKQPAQARWVLPSGAAFGSGPCRGKLAALFPGQGAQYPGMLRDLACQFPAMIDSLELADRVFAAERPQAGDQRLSDSIYPHPAFSDETRRQQEEALKSTDIAQPALGAVALGALNVLAGFGIVPEAAAGHSYGELAALCCAGRLQPEALHRLSNARGRLMAAAGNGHGAMLAVQASEEEVARFVRDEQPQLVIANRNSPTQFVLAGPRALIEDAAQAWAKRSVRARVLPVSAAFHSPMVASAQAPFAAILSDVTFSRGNIPVYANTTARAYPAGARQARELLANQIVQPVNFADLIRAMRQDGVTTFIEAGPGHVLSDLVQAILNDPEVDTIPLDSSKGTRPGVLDLAILLCRTASLGHAVDFSKWEEYPAAAAGSSAKPAFTIPLSGANYRAPRPALPPAPPAPAPAPVAPPATLMPEQPGLTAALQAAQQGILALQKLQEQTAQLHRQFLENQDAARRTLEALLGQRRELAQPSMARSAGPAPSVASVRSIPVPAPVAPVAPVAPIAPPAPVVPAPRAPQPAPASSQVPEAVLAVVAEKTGYPAEMLNLDMGLDSDLGVDSIKRVEIMAALRGRLPSAPEIKPEHLGTLQTLRQVVEFLERGSSAAPAHAPAAVVAAAPAAPAGTDAAQASAALLEVVAEKTGYPVEMLNLDMGLDSDLGVDSIKRVEIMAALRGRLPSAPEIKPEHLGTLQTLRHIVDFLTARAATPAPAAAIPAPAAPEPVRATAGPALNRQVVRPVLMGVETDRARITLPPGARIWITEDGSPLAAAVEQRLQALGCSTLRGSTADLLAAPTTDRPAGLLILWPAARGNDEALKQAFRLIQRAGPALRAAGPGGGVLATVSRLDGVFGFGALNGNGDPISGGLAGLVKTARHEWPEVHCKAIDLNPEIQTGPEAATIIVDELFRVGPSEVGVSGVSRFGLLVETVPFSDTTCAAVLNDGDVVVVTGGARGITALAALQLARLHRPRMVLLGRSPLEAQEPEWLAGLDTEPAIKKALLARSNGHGSPRQVESDFRQVMACREIRASLRLIQETGAQAHYCSVDVRHAGNVRDILNDIRRQFGPIRGLVHGAGVLADRRIEDKTEEQFDAVYHTKVSGLKNLLQALEPGELRLLALFSSYTGRFGRTGQVDYAAANEVLNKIAQSESRRCPDCRVISFNWGPWNGGMVSGGLRQIFEKEGVGLIEPGAGADFFVREISSPANGSVEVLALAPVEPAVLAAPAPETEAPAAFEHEVSLVSMPCLASHVLNGRAVLPVALMIEWLAHGAAHDNPGMAFHGLENFQVLKGLVLEPGAAARVAVLAETRPMDNGLLRVSTRLVTLSGARPILHARADVLLAAQLPVAPAANPAVNGNGALSGPVYGNGRLFHGPHFHGIEKIEACSAASMTAWVRTAPAPKLWVLDPLRPAWLADPLALDSSFQMMILWTWLHRDAASLPCAIRRFRQFVPAFPKEGARVVIQIDPAATPVVTATLQFLDRQGRLLALAEGYECVTDPGLRDAFQRNRLPHEA